MSLCLVYKVVEDVVDLLPDVGSQAEELAIYSVKSCLQEISLSWILGVEEGEKLNKQQELRAAISISRGKLTSRTKR